MNYLSFTNLINFKYLIILLFLVILATVVVIKFIINSKNSTDIDCQGTWSECPESCDSSNRTFTVTTNPSGNGIPCPVDIPPCRNGDGQCTISEQTDEQTDEQTGAGEGESCSTQSDCSADLVCASQGNTPYDFVTEGGPDGLFAPAESLYLLNQYRSVTGNNEIDPQDFKCYKLCKDVEPTNSDFYISKPENCDSGNAIMAESNEIVGALIDKTDNSCENKCVCESGCNVNENTQPTTYPHVSICAHVDNDLHARTTFGRHMTYDSSCSNWSSMPAGSNPITDDLSGYE